MTPTGLSLTLHLYIFIVKHIPPSTHTMWIRAIPLVHDILTGGPTPSEHSQWLGTSWLSKNVSLPDPLNFLIKANWMEPGCSMVQMFASP